ncbi:MAG: MFS transporter [Trueperella sp.]|nr:MFS transporter [Trueperella sp.]
MSDRRSALVVWGAAEIVYIVAIAGRTSFGVAGLVAVDRFQITAAVLSLFTVLQVGVYAGAQIPVGMLLDRHGTRKILLSGAAILAVGQLLLAVAHTLPWALTARVLIGLGDATAFTAVLRLVPHWFHPLRVPLMTQLIGITGQLGQVISSLPFAFILVHIGWTPAFSFLAVLGGAAIVISYFLVSERPPQAKDAAAAPAPQSPALVPIAYHTHHTFHDVLREPGAWLGFWCHWVGNFPNTTFLLLWGVPFLQVHNGYAPQTAAALLLVTTACGIFFGPITGKLTGRHPLRRTWIIYGASSTLFVIWLAILLLPAPAPDWLIILLLIALSGVGAASSVAFDFTRTSVAPRRLGTANGLANMGGFIATLISAALIGIALDLSAGNAPATAFDYKIAMSMQVICWTIGMVGIEISKRRVRKDIAAYGIHIPPVREAIRREWHRREK